ncbi:SAM-dependent DNA methyltransferase [bacterium]|nr:SAM-dependent DNA methyltransferase [bacterium]
MRTLRQKQLEYGDFQTPLNLARDVCSVLYKMGYRPASIIEPTCGTGAFIRAAAEVFTDVKIILGFDVNPHHIEKAKNHILTVSHQQEIIIKESDFYSTDWRNIIKSLEDPILIIGNPPWVTNTKLGVLDSDNIPIKSNVDNLKGIEALTGKGNFDISEYIIRENIDWLSSRRGIIAILCKKSVARKALLYAWKNKIPICNANIYKIDAKKQFNVNVDSCLLLIQIDKGGSSAECREYNSLSSNYPSKVFGFQDNQLIADIALYDKRKNLVSEQPNGWRSGIKHNCSNVFEFRKINEKFINNLGETTDIEPECVFPMLKSSDLFSDKEPNRWMLVPHKIMREDPKDLQFSAPNTYRYLLNHSDLLDNRKSSIFINRPRFSIFGVGGYSFTPWKIAISGLYKELKFVKIGPFKNKPVVLDDTCYFIPCHDEKECEFIHYILCSNAAKEFYSAFIFWDAKRPITAQILNMLDIINTAKEIGMDPEYIHELAERKMLSILKRRGQSALNMMINQNTI